MNSKTTPFSSSTHLDTRVFDMVWSVFENSPHNKHSLTQVLNDLDFEQIHFMLDSLSNTLKTEFPSSCRFALFLDFKSKILDYVLSVWQLERFRDSLDLFHPMECIYMILNSKQDSDPIFSLFSLQSKQVYKVFHYIILWMNWKVVQDSECDECFFHTYFKEYTKKERKKVFGSFSMDLLDYLIQHADLLESVKDISEWENLVPLLCQESLSLFYTLYCKLSHSSSFSSKHSFFILLDSKQVSFMTRGRSQLEYDFWTFLGSLYKMGAEQGDAILLKNKDLLSLKNEHLSSLTEDRDHPVYEIFKQAQNQKECLLTLKNLLNSHIIIDSRFIVLVFQSFVQFKDLVELKETLPLTFREWGKSELVE